MLLLTTLRYRGVYPDCQRYQHVVQRCLHFAMSNIQQARTLSIQARAQDWGQDLNWPTSCGKLKNLHIGSQYHFRFPDAFLGGLTFSLLRLSFEGCSLNWDVLKLCRSLRELQISHTHRNNTPPDLPIVPFLGALSGMPQLEMLHCDIWTDNVTLPHIPSEFDKLTFLGYNGLLFQWKLRS